MDSQPDSRDRNEAPRERDISRRLGYVVQDEARRILSEAQLSGDPKRLADGWERRFIADQQRAAEAVELYTQLGYEVVADPVGPDELGEDCEDCQLLIQLQFKTIYTRKRPPSPQVPD